MKTSIKIIELFTSSGILREYAVFLQLKHLYSNGCIYKYNINKLSQKSGLSRNSIKKYVAFFVSNGWVTMHGDNLCFISLESFRLKYKIKLKHAIKIKNGNTSKVLNGLRYELLKQKTIQFNFLKNISNDLNNPSGKNALQKYKHAKKYANRTGKKLCISESAIKISLKTIGTILNLSPASSFNLIKLKQTEGSATIIRTKFIKSIAECSGKMTKYVDRGYFKGGMYYIPVCNKYVFS